MTTDMYREIILDYYRSPRNKGTLPNPTAKARDTNPSCGDVVEMQLLINNTHIKDIRFEGKGCAISQATASMLTELAKAKTLGEIQRLTSQDVLNLINIPLSPMRLKCAMLPLKVLKLAVYQHLGQRLQEEENAGFS